MNINTRFLEKMGVRRDRAQRFGPSFIKELPEYGINTDLRQMHFLAQILHESGMCRYTKENLKYSAKALRSVFGKYFPDDGIASEYEYQPDRIGARVYANRMGNGDEASGEGYHYRGRGLIQLTGKNNYQKFSDWADKEVVDAPIRVAEEFPLLSAIFYWNTNNLNQYADKDDLRGLTKRINGGYNGLEHRGKLLDLAKQLLDTQDEGLSEGGDRYQVSASSLNLRAAPYIADNNVLKNLTKGTEVFRIKEAKDGWVYIRVVSDNIEGYIAERYLRMI